MMSQSLGLIRYEAVDLAVLPYVVKSGCHYCSKAPTVCLRLWDICVVTLGFAQLCAIRQICWCRRTLLQPKYTLGQLNAILSRACAEVCGSSPGHRIRFLYMLVH